MHVKNDTYSNVFNNLLIFFKGFFLVMGIRFKSLILITMIYSSLNIVMITNAWSETHYEDQIKIAKSFAETLASKSGEKILTVNSTKIEVERIQNDFL